MTITFLAGSTWPLGVLSSTSPTDGDLVAVFLAQADDDRVLVAGFAEHRGLRAGDVGADGVGHTGHGHAEQRRLVAIDAHGDLGPAFFPPHARVGDARRGVEQRLDVLGEPLAKSSRSWPRISTASRPPPPPWPPPPPCRASCSGRRRARARTMTPGRPDSSRRSVHRDLLVAALALVLRDEAHVDVAAVRRAAAAEPAAAAAAW